MIFGSLRKTMPSYSSGVGYGRLGPYLTFTVTGVISQNGPFKFKVDPFIY